MNKERSKVLGLAALALVAVGVLSSCSQIVPSEISIQATSTSSPTKIPMCSIDVGSSTVWGLIDTLDSISPLPHTKQINGNSVEYVEKEPDGTERVLIGVWGAGENDLRSYNQSYNPDCKVVAQGDLGAGNDIDNKLLTPEEIADEKIMMAEDTIELRPYLREFSSEVPHQTDRNSSFESIREARRLKIKDNLIKQAQETFEHVVVYGPDKKVVSDTVNPKPKSKFKGVFNIWDGTDAIVKINEGLEEDRMHLCPWALLKLNEMLEFLHAPAFAK